MQTKKLVTVKNPNFPHDLTNLTHRGMRDNKDSKTIAQIILRDPTFDKYFRKVNTGMQGVYIHHPAAIPIQNWYVL